MNERIKKEIQQSMPKETTKIQFKKVFSDYPETFYRTTINNHKLWIKKLTVTNVPKGIIYNIYSIWEESEKGGKPLIENVNRKRAYEFIRKKFKK